jgi:hypothetical protein
MKVGDFVVERLHAWGVPRAARRQTKVCEGDKRFANEH